MNSDDEAKEYANNMPFDIKFYPVVYSSSNTTGEKSYEEFYVKGEKLNLERFKGLGVIEKTTHRSINEINVLFDELNKIFDKSDFTKQEIVEVINSFLPNFEHEELGRNLDQKM